MVILLVPDNVLMYDVCQCLQPRPSISILERNATVHLVCKQKANVGQVVLQATCATQSLQKTDSLPLLAFG